MLQQRDAVFPRYPQQLPEIADQEAAAAVRQMDRHDPLSLRQGVAVEQDLALLDAVGGADQNAGSGQIPDRLKPLPVVPDDGGGIGRHQPSAQELPLHRRDQATVTLRQERRRIEVPVPEPALLVPQLAASDQRGRHRRSALSQPVPRQARFGRVVAMVLLHQRQNFAFQLAHRRAVEHGAVRQHDCAGILQVSTQPLRRHHQQPRQLRHPAPVGSGAAEPIGQDFRRYRLRQHAQARQDTLVMPPAPPRHRIEDAPAADRGRRGECPDDERLPGGHRHGSLRE